MAYMSTFYFASIRKCVSVVPYSNFKTRNILIWQYYNVRVFGTYGIYFDIYKYILHVLLLNMLFIW